MTNYTITLTQTENDALSYVAVSPNDWIQNVVHDRCRIAIDEIVEITVKKCLELGIQIPGSKDEMVSLAFSSGWIKTAEERLVDFENNIPFSPNE